MSEDRTFTEREAHLYFAKTLFNRVWALLDQPSRSAAEDDELLLAAYGSRAHWGAVGDATNHAIGEWQIARVWAVLGDAANARRHGSRALALAEGHALGAFHVGFAHEALARAAAVAGDAAARDRHLALAEQAAKDVADEDDRAALLSDLASVPR